MNQKKTIYEYDNYREFLRDFYERSKSENKKFSLGLFSKTAGFKSRSVLRQVMAGERNIAPYSIEKFAKALKLTKHEAEYFKNLVCLNQASSLAEKTKFAEEILRSKNYKKVHPLRDAQFNYFNKWFIVAVRELACVSGFQNDPEWVARQIKPPITVAEAKLALEELFRLGFLQHDANGNVVSNDAWLATDDEVTSTAIVGYHKELLKRAAESIERFPRDKRDISAQTFAVSEKTAKKVKEMIQQFRQQIVSVVSKDLERDAVYQLNFQLFPMALLEEKKTE